MLEVLHELVDAVHSLKAITGNRRAELHELLDADGPLTGDDRTNSDIIRVTPSGKTGDGPISQEEKANPDIIRVSEPGGYGAGDVPAGA